MKNYIKGIFFAMLMGLTACGDDFLTVQPTSNQEAGGPATEGAIMANIGACYQILLFDSYADFNYNSVVFMSDIMSDDIFKGGGSAGDQAVLYSISQYSASATETPAGLWNIYFNGLNRCNNAIAACENAVDVDADRLAQLKGEALFLRAYYVHWLWKFWGNIPYFEEELEAPYMAPQYTADQIYAEIVDDLDFVINESGLPMRTDVNNHGRVTLSAAMMLKARVVMYQNDSARFSEVMTDMQRIYSEAGFSLADYSSIWDREGEFGSGSIFEVNHLPEGKDWGEAWAGYGTNLPEFISPNELTGADLLSGSDEYKGGWGFGPVRHETVAIFEEGDPRLAASVNQFAAGTYVERFQNTNYFMAKYAARKEYNDAPYGESLNYENNVRVFRFAETLLNIAELEIVHGVANTGLSAQDAMDMVRNRVGIASIPATTENIKLERRREFLGEGMRYWDLVRWGDTDLLNESIPEFSSERTWSVNKKHLPIPLGEINRTEGDFKLVQNPY
ncbi:MULTISPECIES: RagB/SusD family nutrient uptake outer membrane protein [unclassified Carboxylicivirga]|uniref:RagB/SusD family nutrient uptake outer membrane protein n=1 Tax=Carboxylicivirga TaxID=1628153 RepID=UPI003D342B13